MKEERVETWEDIRMAYFHQFQPEQPCTEKDSQLQAMTATTMIKDPLQAQSLFCSTLTNTHTHTHTHNQHHFVCPETHG